MHSLDRLSIVSERQATNLMTATDHALAAAQESCWTDRMKRVHLIFAAILFAGCRPALLHDTGTESAATSLSPRVHAEIQRLVASNPDADRYSVYRVAFDHLDVTCVANGATQSSYSEGISLESFTASKQETNWIGLIAEEHLLVIVGTAPRLACYDHTYRQMSNEMISLRVQQCLPRDVATRATHEDGH